MDGKQPVKDLYERSARRIAERLLIEETAPLHDTIVRLRTELAVREAENTRLRSELVDLSRAYDRLTAQLSTLEKLVFDTERKVTAGLNRSKSG